MELIDKIFKKKEPPAIVDENLRSRKEAEIKDELRSQKDFFHHQKEMLSDISNHLPSFGPPRQSWNKMVFQLQLSEVDVEKKALKKQLDNEIISKEEFDKKVNELNNRITDTQIENSERIADTKSNAFTNHSHQIVYAFTCNNVDYYQFAEFNNMPPLRSLKTMVFYEEMRMKCTLEYLELHAQAVDNILSKEKISIFEIKKLNDQLKQRLYIALDIELLYKLATIIFFDKDEDFTDYDFSYNATKAANWKKYDGLGFFLHQPMQELVPILKNVNENLETYSKVVGQMNEAHLENILLNLPSNVREKLKNKSYFSQVVMPVK